MNINKYEATGIAVSIGLMVLALFFIRLDRAPDILSGIEGESQTASPIMVAGDDGAALANALNESRTQSGDVERLIIDDVVLGSGPEVAEGDTVTVHYIGSLQNGQQFDNSRRRGEPFTFTVGQDRVIPGWNTGILGMQQGGQRVLVVPPELAYGEDGYGPIPGDATLVFVLELLAIE